jgi:hypothetical protein
LPYGLDTFPFSGGRFSSKFKRAVMLPHVGYADFFSAQWNYIPKDKPVLFVNTFLIENMGLKLGNERQTLRI